jgi:riboflavin kinase/FMN adenylyltransferase
MMNIGFNPTVSGEKLSIEVHFFDFDTDLYDQKIKVSILKYIRTEQQFDSVDLLTKQLDKSTAITYLQEL